MIASLDPFGLLTLSSTSLDTGKLYQHSFQGYQISSENHELFVYHKKAIKLIELKNIGNSMGVFFVQKRAPFQHFPLDKKAFAAAGQLFEARDEEIGESYFFLPYLSHKEVESKNRILQRLEIGMELVPSSKGVLWQHAEKETSDLQGREEILSFLFGLVMLFGKIESKGVQCNSIKIHLPLFGQYLQIAETLENLLQQLQKEGIFLQSSTNEHQGQISYQITSNDWELLELFAEWYKDIEKLTKITKKEFVSEAVQQLEAFLQQQQIEQAEEIQELLRKSTVKVLVKT